MDALGLMLAAALAPALGAPAGVSVSIHRDAAVYHLQGEFRVHAPGQTAWSVLTDYNGLPRYVPTMKKSVVVSRGPGELVVEQEGVGSFLFFSKTVRLKLAVRELPPDRIYFSQVGGSPFDLYEGRWTITPGGQGSCVVAYDLAVEPHGWLGPSPIARRTLVKNIANQLEAVKAEMERRAGPVVLAGAGDAGS